MLISAIFAMSKNRVIGKDNDLPWYLSDDLKFFKKKTLGHHILMGRKSFESIGRPLPKRTNLILTRDPFYAVSNALVTHSLEEAFSIAADNGEEELFVIGGEAVFRQALPYIDVIYMSYIDEDIEGDTFFPEIDDDEWELVEKKNFKADEKNDYDFEIRVLRRKDSYDRSTVSIHLADPAI